MCHLKMALRATSSSSSSLSHYKVLVCASVCVGKDLRIWCFIVAYEKHFLPLLLLPPPHKRLHFLGKSICPILTHWRIRLNPTEFPPREPRRKRMLFAFGYFFALPERAMNDAMAKAEKAMLLFESLVQLRSSFGKKKLCMCWVEWDSKIG